MRDTDVAEIVAADVRKLGQFDSGHGISLESVAQRLIVPPVRRAYYNSVFTETAIMLDVWLVLAEDPKTHGGYQILYDPDDGWYLLGMTSSEGENIILNCHETLKEALERM